MDEDNVAPLSSKKILHYGSLEGKVAQDGKDAIQQGIQSGNINITNNSE